MNRSAAPKILVVDDDPDLTSLLKRTFTRESYKVEVAHSGRDGLRLAYTFRPDLIILDVTMPGMDGWDTLRRIRELCDIPVVLLTGLCCQEEKAKGLDMGADDYVTKPFGLQELRARIQAVLRRSPQPFTNERCLLRFRGDHLVIDPLAQRVLVGGQPVALTPTEYKLLLYLAYNAGRVLTVDQILDGVWGPGYEDSTNSVKVYIRRLRLKIERDPGRPVQILSLRGAGYCLARS